MLNKLKTSLLSILVFTILMFSSAVFAGGYTSGCEIDKITGEKSGWVRTPAAKVDNPKEIYSALIVRKNEKGIWIFMGFDYLKLNNKVSKHTELISVFKRGGKPSTNKYFIENDKWLHVRNIKPFFNDMKKYSEFLIRLPYTSYGDITFTYSIEGFADAWNNMKHKCGFGIIKKVNSPKDDNILMKERGVIIENLNKQHLQRGKVIVDDHYAHNGFEYCSENITYELKEFVDNYRILEGITIKELSGDIVIYIIKFGDETTQYFICTDKQYIAYTKSIHN